MDVLQNMVVDVAQKPAFIQVFLTLFFHNISEHLLLRFTMFTERQIDQFALNL